MRRECSVDFSRCTLKANLAALGQKRPLSALQERDLEARRGSGYWLLAEFCSKPVADV